jgi:hypothetical protein
VLLLLRQQRQEQGDLAEVYKDSPPTKLPLTIELASTSFIRRSPLATRSPV